MRRRTPIAALLEGLIAGAIGAGVQTLFFRATRSITPPSPPDAFRPPKPQAAKETQTEMVARRLVEGLAQRGPLSEQAKKRGAELVHYGFGAGWGALYGLLRESYPSMRRPSGVLGFSAAVWLLGDNLLLPVIRVAGWPHRYPLKTHAYALAAHLAYGAGVAGTLTVLDHGDLALLCAGAVSSRGRSFGRRAIARSRALVPRSTLEGARRLAEALARRAHDLRV